MRRRGMIDERRILVDAYVGLESCGSGALSLAGMVADGDEKE